MSGQPSSAVFAALAAVLAALMPAPAAAEVRVVDGDTIAMDGQRVRLFGIDAPERGQPGADAATAALALLVGDERPVCEQVDYDVRSRRPVSLCSVRGADLSAAMLRAGHAVAWCSFLRKLRPNLLRPFLEAQDAAKRARRGLWARPFAPWRDWGC